LRVDDVFAEATTKRMRPFWSDWREAGKRNPWADHLRNGQAKGAGDYLAMEA
jgi:hypothetical protein